MSIDNKQKHGCLTSLSNVVLDIIRTNDALTFQEVCDLIIKNHSKVLDKSKDKTSKRRIYDVINVFIAADLIKKEQKLIRISNTFERNIRSGENSILKENCVKIKEEILKKQSYLMGKIQSYLLLSELVEVNRHRICGMFDTKIPAIFIKSRKDTNFSVKQAPRKLVIQSKANEHPGNGNFFSPMFILGNMNLNLDRQKKRLLETWNNPIIEELLDERVRKDYDED